MKKTIAVDFDGTLCRLDWPNIGPPGLPHILIAYWVKYRQRKGDFIILNTCREGDALARAVYWLRHRYGFWPNATNANNPELIKAFGDCRKIGGDLYIDDKNIGLIGWILRHWPRKIGSPGV